MGIDKLVTVSAEKGYGVTTGFGYTKTFVKGISFTPLQYDRTGYYVVAGGTTYKKMFWQKYLDGNFINY